MPDKLEAEWRQGMQQLHSAAQVGHTDLYAGLLELQTGAEGHEAYLVLCVDALALHRVLHDLMLTDTCALVVPGQLSCCLDLHKADTDHMLICRSLWDKTGP